MSTHWLRVALITAAAAGQFAIAANALTTRRDHDRRRRPGRTE
jgi:hypothetical protein